MRCITCSPSRNITIVQGSDVTVVVQLFDKNTGKPFSLAGYTSSTGFFPAAAGGSVSATGALQSSDLGQVSIFLSKVLTALMAVGDTQGFQVDVDLGSTRVIAQFPENLTVNASLF